MTGFILIRLRIRKNKLTASRFGRILKAMKKKAGNSNYTLPFSLFKQFTVQHDLSNVKASLRIRNLNLYEIVF